VVKWYVVDEPMKADTVLRSTDENADTSFNFAL
jgi:hypothetical protein